MSHIPIKPEALLQDLRYRNGGHWGVSRTAALEKIIERDDLMRNETANKVLSAIKAELKNYLSMDCDCSHKCGQLYAYENIDNFVDCLLSIYQGVIDEGAEK